MRFRKLPSIPTLSSIWLWLLRYWSMLNTFLHLLGWSCIFCFYFIDMVYYITYFFGRGPILHSWDKPHLAMVYNFLYVIGFDLLIFWKDFYIYIHKRYWSVVCRVFFTCNVFVWFWYQSDTGLTEIAGKYSPLMLVF